MNDLALDLLLRGSASLLGDFSQKAFGVSLALARNGADSGDACSCPVCPGDPEESRRSFTGSLFTPATRRKRCPEGLRVLTRKVDCPDPESILLLSHGFLDEGDPPKILRFREPVEVPRLSSEQAHLLEGFMGLGADLLAKLAHPGTADALDQAREEAWRDLLVSPTIVGISPAVRALRESLPTFANSREPLLIFGEPGSGRRLLAVCIHRLGPRAGRPFIAEGLAALPETLQEAELFGAGGTTGLLDDAEGGTLYLSNIERLTLRCQERLLAHLTRKTDKAANLSPRVATSSDVDLDEAVRRGTFLGDLASCLRTLVLSVPPLRERPEDLPLLAEHLLQRRAAALGTAATTLSAEAVESLVKHPWADNVRELEAELARVATGRAVIRPEDFSGPIARSAHTPVATSRAPLRHAVGELEVKLIAQALSDTNWNKSRSARILGLSRLGLQKKIDRYGIDRRT